MSAYRKIKQTENVLQIICYIFWILFTEKFKLTKMIRGKTHILVKKLMFIEYPFYCTYFKSLVFLHSALITIYYKNPNRTVLFPKYNRTILMFILSQRYFIGLSSNHDLIHLCISTFVSIKCF